MIIVAQKHASHATWCYAVLEFIPAGVHVISGACLFACQRREANGKEQRAQATGHRGAAGNQFGCICMCLADYEGSCSQPQKWLGQATPATHGFTSIQLTIKIPLCDLVESSVILFLALSWQDHALTENQDPRRGLAFPHLSLGLDDEAASFAGLF